MNIFDKKYIGIILLYAHIKNTSFSFFNKRFLGCSFQICNPFFFSVGTGKWTSAFVSAGQNTHINTSSIRKITANPKNHSS